MKKLRLLRRSVLFGASALGLWAAQLGCTGDTKLVSGCQSDAQCQEGQICRASDGKCVPKPTYAKVTIDKSLGDGSGVVTSSPAGLDCGSTCSASFEVGVPVTLTATPASGSSLGSFSVGCSSGQTTCSFTPMDTQDIRVLVTFNLGSGGVTPALCNSFGFCWENPKPTGNRLHDVAVLPSGEIYAVGDAGTILRRSGGNFSLVSTGLLKNLYGVWGSGTDVYVVGEGGTIYHGVNGVFSAENSGGVTTDLYDVHGTGGLVFAAGANGRILRRNGSATWTADTSNTGVELRSIYATSTSDIWAAGAGGTATRWNGASWTATTGAIGSYTVRAMSGSSGGPLYAVDSFGGIFSYTTSWASVRSMPASDDLYGVAVVGGVPYVAGSNLGAMVLHYNGSSWVRDVNGLDAFRAVGGTSASDLWAVGESGTVWQSNGSPWAQRSTGVTSNLNGVWSTDPQHAWAVGNNGTLLVYNGSYVSPVSVGSSGTNWNGVWASGPNDVFIVGSGGVILHYNGTNWVNTPSGTGQTLRGVHGVSSTKAFAVGDGGTALTWNGSAWSGLSTVGGDLNAVWAASATDIVAVGAGGSVQRSSGGNFSAVTAPGTSASLGGVAGQSGNDFWVSADTALYHYTSGTWTSTTPAPAVSGLRGMWSLNGSDIYAVGASGALLHYTGVSWNRVDNGVGPNLAGVSVASRRLWTVGSGGTVLRQDF